MTMTTGPFLPCSGHPGLILHQFSHSFMRKRGDSSHFVQKKWFFCSCNNPHETKESSFSLSRLKQRRESVGRRVLEAITLKPRSPGMARFQSALLGLILACLYPAVATEDEWRSATATYTKEMNGSIIIEGACGYGDLHRASYGRHIAGLSTGLFNRGRTCGACFEVRCVDHILWCLPGSPSVTVTATDFCPPNYGLPNEYGGWCNFPREHFEMSEAAFAEIAERRADIVPVQYRRVNCARTGGIRFTISGGSHFFQVLVSNVGLDGEVVAVKVKGSRTGWMPMGRNWGQTWQCNAQLSGQPLSFEVTTRSGRTITSYGVSPLLWQFGQTFAGKQF